MRNPKFTPKGWVDVFHAFLIKGAIFDSFFEIPWLKSAFEIPILLIPFSKALKSKLTDAFVHFYEHDVKIQRVWNRPRYYFKYLQRFKGVITPDFSVYRNMPLIVQIWNIFRSRALGFWWQTKGLTVIPNVRWSDRRTYRVCCAGIIKGSVIAVGTHGCIKGSENREYFKNGLEYVIKRIKPSAIIVYGTCPDDIFKKYKDEGIQIIPFKCEFKLVREAVK